MIRPDETLSLLRKFFKCQSPFDEAAELTGHASSGKPDVFVRWFTSLPVTDKEAICHALTGCVLFRDELNDFLPQAAFLLVELAAKRPRSFSRESIKALEDYMKRGNVVSSWLVDQDSEFDHLKNYRSRWRFALSLWNVLYVLKSPVAMESFRAFASRAKDPEFVRSLEIAKRFRDAEQPE